ncbi:tape measure protein [Streptococcus phage SW16]|uniref:Tape measure protein n=2 Tax=Piorkowskivirus TaxID=3044792 RepID=A0A3S5XCH9_9CAUD|nr:tail protein [Streptococcus phage SW22]YP_010663551.1 tail protein [Streptococcus phage SW16]AYP29729.1 tape measure protein [Streptococcus phage SW20]AYP29820.1 tape measure protein [Streptococcus phage SW25]AYP29866.1 tape measure protein [Streptococcus phage SW26]AYP29956.1 tape measure protein [Streptococcus phage SW28]AYR04461.1 tape measure protein [Streptococcus phage SW17]AYR04507.1 tape measure protein [Streptococcus phage SW23]
MESYSVEAVLSAVDKNFTSTMNKADSSMRALNKNSQNTNTSIQDIAKGVGVFKLIDSAVGLVRNSLDGAINRFDTLKNYPKVMAQMGFSTNDVAKSTELLKKGVDGLPTSLQELTKSSQSFAILEKSATGGAKTAIALNDAFLASGASAADASRGVQQYSQMLSSGKVDLMSWRTLQETMPYALTQVAKSFGLTGKSAERDLYAKLQSGDITMKQLNKRFVELDGGVKGFAQTARTATGGIGTSFTNMKNAVLNGITGVLKTIDIALQNNGFKNGIATVFDGMKQSIIDTFKNINFVLSKVLPSIITAFVQLGNILKPFTPLLKGLGGGFTTLIAIVGGMLIFQKVAGAVKTLFAALTANPYVLAIAGIVALVLAIKNLWDTNKGFRDAVIQIWQSISDFLQPVIEFISGIITNTFTQVSQWFTENQQGIQNLIQTVWGVIQGVFEVAMIAIQAVVSLALGQMQAGWEIWSNVISGIVQVAWALISNIFSGSLDNILAVVTFVIKQVQLVIDTVMNVIQGIIKTVWSLIIGDWQGALDGINQIVGAFGNYITGTFDNVMGLAKDLIKNGIDTIKGIFDSLSKINLFDIGKAIIDGFVKGLKSSWEAGMKFIGGIGDWIREHKGPIRKDRKLLIPAGNAIMNGLNSGLTRGFRDVQSNVSGMGDMIANAINSDYSVDIGANVAAANRSISSQVSHDVNLNQGKQPASFTVKLGNQTFKAFVDDISNAQGQAINLNMGF